MTSDAHQEFRRVRVASVTEVAQDVRAYELVSADGRPLPAWTPGSHVDVHSPCGLVRQYSLCNDPRFGDRYRIAVKKEAEGRGGSRSMHEDVATADLLAISPPRNYFPLSDGAGSSLLIAGGIGITPVYAMVHALAAANRPWMLHYCARSAAHAAFHEELQALAPQSVVTHFSEVPVLDVPSLIAAQGPDVHIYCCGPVGLMSAVKDATANRSPEHVHFEWFAAPDVDHSQDQSFEIELARSGRVASVPPDRSILQVVRDCGVDAPSSCEAGVCGTCETRLLAGEADHRDLLLTEEERAQNASIMICVSRARSKRLVLDL